MSGSATAHDQNASNPEAGRGFSSAGSAAASSARSTRTKKASGIVPSLGPGANSRTRLDLHGQSVPLGKPGRPPIYVAPAGTTIDAAAESSSEGTAYQTMASATWPLSQRCSFFFG